MTKHTNSWGIAGFILAILSIFFLGAPYFGLAMAILAIVFYGIQKREGKTGLATSGFIIGIVGIVLNVVMIIVFIGSLAFVGFLLGSADGIVVNVHEESPDEISINATLPEVWEDSDVEGVLISIKKFSKSNSS